MADGLSQQVLRMSPPRSVPQFPPAPCTGKIPRKLLQILQKIVRSWDPGWGCSLPMGRREGFNPQIFLGTCSSRMDRGAGFFKHSPLQSEISLPIFQLLTCFPGALWGEIPPAPSPGTPKKREGEASAPGRHRAGSIPPTADAGARARLTPTFPTCIKKSYSSDCFPRTSVTGLDRHRCSLSHKPSLLSLHHTTPLFLPLKWVSSVKPHAAQIRSALQDGYLFLLKRRDVTTKQDTSRFALPVKAPALPARSKPQIFPR